MVYVSTSFVFISDSPEAETESIWNDREFVAAVAIGAVAFVILILLLLAICLLVFYHRKVNRLNKYGLGKFSNLIGYCVYVYTYMQVLILAHGALLV